MRRYAGWIAVGLMLLATLLMLQWVIQTGWLANVNHTENDPVTQIRLEYRILFTFQFFTNAMVIVAMLTSRKKPSV
jgi:hypothetical protein